MTYRVIKTIKGRRYLYEQKTWREDGRVKTKSTYIGPADSLPSRGSSSGAGKAVESVMSGLLTGVAAWGQSVSDQAGPTLWASSAGAQLGLTTATKKRSKRATTKHRKVPAKRKTRDKIFVGVREGKRCYVIRKESSLADTPAKNNEVWLYEI
jgi:hypothetical protein